MTEFINALPVREQAEVRNALRLLREFRTLLGMPHARPLTGHHKLWELRPGPNRLLYFAHTGRRFIILHGFRKRLQRTPALEPAYQIARLRILRGLTQEELASMIGTKQPSIASLESGSTEPSLSFLRKVAAALGARVEVRIVPADDREKLTAVR